MDAYEATEQQIIDALASADGTWTTQAQIRKATGLPKSRVENFTLAMALQGKIGRTLTPCHHTQLFRALAPHEQGTGALVYSDPPNDQRANYVTCRRCTTGR